MGRMPADPINRYVEWMRTKGLSMSIVNRRSAFLRAAEHDMGISLLAAKPDQITALLALLQRRGHCDATRHVYAGHLRTFYNWGIGQGYCRRNPVLSAAVPRRPRYLPRPIADDGLMIAIDTAEPRVRVILMLAALGALRACEIARLRREDVLDHIASPVLLVQGKGNKPRAVALSESLLAELQLYGMPARGAVIRRWDGLSGHVSPSLISSVANTHLHSLGITDTLHSLRHWSASSLYQDTKDIRLVQETLGHSSPSVTAIYAEWSRADAPPAMKRLADRLMPTPETA